MNFRRFLPSILIAIVLLVAGCGSSTTTNQQSSSSSTTNSSSSNTATESVVENTAVADADNAEESVAQTSGDSLLDEDTFYRDDASAFAFLYPDSPNWEVAEMTEYGDTVYVANLPQALYYYPNPEDKSVHYALTFVDPYFNATDFSMKMTITAALTYGATAETTSHEVNDRHIRRDVLTNVIEADWFVAYTIETAYGEQTYVLRSTEGLEIEWETENLDLLLAIVASTLPEPLPTLDRVLEVPRLELVQVINESRQAVGRGGTTIDISFDGERILLLDGGNRIALFDAETYELIYENKYRDAVDDVALSPDNQMVLFGFYNSSRSNPIPIRFWEIEAEDWHFSEPWFNEEEGTNLYRVMYHPDGERIVTASSTWLKLRDIESQEILAEQELAEPIVTIAPFNDTGYLYVGTGGGLIYQLDDETLEVVGRIHLVSDVEGWQELADNAYTGYDTVAEVDIIPAQSDGEDVRISAFTWLGSQVAILPMDFEDAPDTITPFILPHVMDIRTIAYSPDGSLIASGDEEGNILLASNTESYEPLYAGQYGSEVLDIQFLDNETILAAVRERNMTLLMILKPLEWISEE